MNLNELLNLAKDRTGSDYQTARELGNKKGSYVWNWRKGLCKPNASARVLLARITGVSLEEVNAIIELEGETDSKKIALWKKLGGIAAALVLSNALAPTAEQVANTVYYVK